jgi:cytochrome P450
MARRSLPLVGDLLAFQSDRLGFITEQHRRNGDVAQFRLGRYRVWQLSHPDQVRDVLVTQAARFQKGFVLQRARMVLGEGLLTVEGERHRQYRRLIQPVFQPRQIEKYADVMIEKAAIVIHRWRPDEPRDIHADIIRITLTTAASTFIGADLDDDVPLVEQAMSDLLSAYTLMFVPFGNQLQRLPVGRARRLRRGRASLHRLVDRAIAQHTGEDLADPRGTGRGRTDADRRLLSALLTAGSNVDPAMIRDQIATLLLAGHETVAATVSFALYLLAVHPRAQERIDAEIDEVVDDLPVADDADRLPVCRAVVSEALRLYPPAWMRAGKLSMTTTSVMR